MLKFFRKYNKIILVIGGSFLMVSFLLMDTLSRWSGQLGLQTAYAEIDGSKVSRATLGESVNDLQVVRQIAPEILSYIGISTNDMSDHWFLLTYEAEKAGLIGGPGDGGAEFIQTAANLIADQQARLTAQQFQGFSNIESIIANQRQQTYDLYSQRLAANRQRMLQQGQPERAIDMALAKMRAIIRLLQSQPALDTISRPRAISYATEMFDVAFAEIGVIPPNARDAAIPDATDAEIREHFEQYKDQRPSDNELGIGYLLEPAVKLESIGVERQPIIDSLSVDEIDVNKFWRKNKDRFGETWSEAKQAATNAFKEDLADSILERATRIVQRETLRTTRNISGDGAYKDLPEDWDDRKISLERLTGILQQELSKEFEFNMPRPVLRSVSNRWLDRRDLNSLAGLGGSDWRLNETTSIPFADMMMNARAFDGNEAYGVQRGVIIGPFRSDEGVYFARIEDVRRQGVPESITDGLRDRIKEDIRAVKVYKGLVDYADEYKAQLVDTGFEDAFGQIAPNRTLQDAEVSRSVVATPGQQRVLERFNTEAVRDTVMDRVQGWDPLANVEEDIPLDQRVFVVPMPSERSLAAIHVYGRNPLTIEEYREGSSMVRTVAMEKRSDAMEMRPYTLRNLIDRLNVTFYDMSGEERDLFEGDQPVDEQTEAESEESPATS